MYKVGIFSEKELICGLHFLNSDHTTECCSIMNINLFRPTSNGVVISGQCNVHIEVYRRPTYRLQTTVKYDRPSHI